MGNVISRFERLIDRINVIYGLLIPVGLMTAAALSLWVFAPGYYQPHSLTLYTFVIVTVLAVVALHFSLLSKLGRSQLWAIYIFYHIALAIFTIFIGPYLSPFDSLWVVLAIGMDLLFGRKWVGATFATYALALTLTFLHTHQVGDAQNLLRTCTQIFGVIGIVLLVSRYREISDDERHALDNSSRSNTFERQRLLSLINNMGEAVIATDQHGKILLYNAAVLNLLDTNQSLDGKAIDDVLSLKTIKKQSSVSTIKLAHKYPLGYTSSEYTHNYSADDMVRLYLNIAPIKLGFKERSQSGYIILLRDITKEKSLEDERDEFISVVSHELRTPVAIAEGNISNAIFSSKKEDGSAVINTSLKQAHDQVLFLASMINDLATLSRAERTDVPLEITEVSPAAVIQTIGRDYSAEAQTKGLSLTATVANDVVPIFSSALYVNEILQNFVTNSLKYTKKGSILVHARSDSKGNAVFSVADTGIGLSKSDQRHVFEKFFRSEDYRTRESSGTGLGLYVTFKLAHRLGAKIDMESELNKGSTFTITIPSLPVKHRFRKSLPVVHSK